MGYTTKGRVVIVEDRGLYGVSEPHFTGVRDAD